MKTLKVKSILFSLLAMTAVAVFMTSCGQPEEIKPNISDAALLESIFNADAVVGKGEMVDDDKLKFAVQLDELSEDIVAQLENREAFNLSQPLDISVETVTNIWGNELNEHILENGLQINSGEYKVSNVYMNPEGDDMSDLVEQDPSIIERDGTTTYIIIKVKITTIITEYDNGDIEVTITGSISVESCTVIP